MAKKYTADEMRKMAYEMGCEYGDHPEACEMLIWAADMMELSAKNINWLKMALDEVKTMQCVYSCEHEGLESGNLNNVKVIIERSIKELTEWKEVK